MEMFGFMAPVMMLLYLVAIKFPIPYTPLEAFQFALRFLFLSAALLWRVELSGTRNVTKFLRVDDFKFFFSSSF